MVQHHPTRPATSPLANAVTEAKSPYRSAGRCTNVGNAGSAAGLGPAAATLCAEFISAEAGSVADARPDRVTASAGPATAAVKRGIRNLFPLISRGGTLLDPRCEPSRPPET
jgi:hypothetical protein